eukprot:365052-Chlamydomonas_euryale.AAC.18
MRAQRCCFGVHSRGRSSRRAHCSACRPCAQPRLRARWEFHRVLLKVVVAGATLIELLRLLLLLPPQMLCVRERKRHRRSNGRGGKPWVDVVGGAVLQDVTELICVKARFRQQGEGACIRKGTCNRTRSFIVALG